MSRPRAVRKGALAAVIGATALAACSQEPQLYPVLDAKYEECLSTELTKAGYPYERIDTPTPPSNPPTAWPARSGYIKWTPRSEEAHRRLWCEVAFCYASTRDVTKGAFPDMCAAYQ